MPLPTLHGQQITIRPIFQLLAVVPKGTITNFVASYLEPVTTAVLPARDMCQNENRGRGAEEDGPSDGQSYLPGGGIAAAEVGCTAAMASFDGDKLDCMHMAVSLYVACSSSTIRNTCCRFLCRAEKTLAKLS
jgi:hypothetical protein